MNAGTKIVFVAGIHGVGKTGFVSNLARALKLPNASAGKLISDHKKVLSDTDKRVKDVTGNQDALIEAIRLSPLSGSTFILDGHFCVIDASGKVQKIPKATFEALSLICVVLLTNDIRVIQDRLRRRDDKEYLLETLMAMQKAETTHAQEVCSSLGIPLEIRTAPDIASARKFIGLNLAK